MKRLLPLLILLTLPYYLHALPDIQSTKKYHLVCQQFTSGCVTDGATAQQQTPLYYLAQATTNAETYWILTEESTGKFSIKNAKTSQYITYDGVREDIANNGVLRRYISMTDEKDGNNSLWTFDLQEEGVYTIRNVAQNDHIWDVRVDSYCVGTYSNSGSGNQNQRFSIYDENNFLVTEKSNNPTVSGIDVSSWLDANTNSLEGWINQGGFFMNTGAGGSHYNGDANTVAPFIENWHSTSNGSLDDCSLIQKLEFLPAGSYTLQADIIAVWQGYNNWWDNNPEAPATGVWLVANNESTVASTANDKPERYTVNVTIDNQGELKLGIKAESTNANWIAIDNLKLYFNGSQSELMAGEVNKVKNELADYYTADEIAKLMEGITNDFTKMETLRKTVSSLPSIDAITRAYGQLAINGHALAYVASEEIFLCPIPEEDMKKTNFTANIQYTVRDGYKNLKIGTTTVAPGSDYTFRNMGANKEYTLRINKEDGSYSDEKIVFTSLPVVKIYGSFNNSYSQGSIMVLETQMDSLPNTMLMKAKWRGGITNGGDKHKRNYHVKLLDEEGNKLEKKFFGLRNDNSWILESCQVDMCRVRNRVLTDLWNDYSTPPYYIAQEKKAKTGTRGQFVELILNDDYRGIYCMTENMDRKQMKLAKFDEETGEIHGQLWKSKDWSYATFMGTIPDGGYTPKDYLSDPNENSEMWDSYQVKYPDMEDLSPTDWKVLYDAVNFVCTSSDDLFNHYVYDYFDMPLVIDYYILMETILSTDNHGKNMFFACYDKKKSSKITFGVWDMDATCGQRWSDSYFHASFLGPEQDYAEYISRYEHGDYNLFKRLRDTDAQDFNMKVRLRYRDLRQNYLATDSILNRFKTYLAQFKTAGADNREYAKWSFDSDVSGQELNFEDEMEYLTDWFTRRMEYLDNTRFDIGSLPVSGIETVANGNHKRADDPVYNLNGTKVGTRSQLKNLPSGFYIVGGKKVVVGQ